MSTTQGTKPSEPSGRPRRFSSSASVLWFDREAALETVRAAVRELARRHPEIRRVVLFGSLAKGNAVPGSDADLLIVLADYDRPFLERLVIYRPMAGALGIDVFPYSEAELDRMIREDNWLVRTALAEGVELDLGR